MNAPVPDHDPEGASAPVADGAVQEPRVAPRRPDGLFMLRHPARWIALGFGSGLAPFAPGTVGTLWAWAFFWAIQPFLTTAGWIALIGLGLVGGWWACTRTAQHLGISDPGAIVWDEILAFWIILVVISPAPVLWQVVAFGLFRYFDAAKPGPVGWADRLHKAPPGEAPGWAQGWGILFDDLVAAGCTLLVLAVAYRVTGGW